MPISKASRYVGMSQDFLRSHKEEIGYFLMGTQLRFRKADLDAYLAKARHEPERVSG